jgi:hypothetical protein
MGAQDAQKVTCQGVVDRIEEEVAVIFLDGGNAAFLPRVALPSEAGEGSGIEIAVRVVPNPIQGEVADLLDHLGDG